MHAGSNPHGQRMAKALYKSRKKNVVHAEAQAIITTAPNKNPFEAWRLLFAKFDPRNDATAQNIIDDILDKPKWKCHKLSEVPLKVAKWAALRREHVTRTGEEAINTASRRQLFKDAAG